MVGTIGSVVENAIRQIRYERGIGRGFGVSVSKKSERLVVKRKGEVLFRFNEQTNENPGEHFTPREVMRLMVLPGSSRCRKNAIMSICKTRLPSTDVFKWHWASTTLV